MLNTIEASIFLNAHIETIRRLARKGDIPSFKIGKDWRFRKEDLVKWAQTHHLRNQLSTVLIVDDEPSVRSLICHLLNKKKGLLVFEAENGIDGLQCLKNETVDLILLDLEMPGMNGVEFLNELRHAGIKIPVILITAYPDSRLINDAMQYSPLMLIPKPFDKQQLLRAVGAIIKIPG
ncbi:MAG: response regulator [Desulfosalsimonadaceae bacterium]|nr:response regulator [Desulfosalsimonadaceae bacterium]